MRVLVTGATGNLGQAVVARLREEGHTVAVLTRRPFRAAAVLDPGISIHEWHPLSEPVPAAAVDEADAVLHLMGSPLAGGPARGRRALAVASRVTTTRRLAEAMKGRGLRLVMTSVAIAPGEAGDAVTESTEQIGAPTSLERDIASWEAEALDAAAAGTSVAVVRLGLIAMPGEPLDSLLRLARTGVCPDLRGASIPAIALTDAAALLTGLAQHRTLEGIMHGVAPEPLHGEGLMRSLRSHAPAGRAVAVPLHLLSRQLGLMTALLSCHRPILPMRLAAAGAAYAAPDPMPAIEAALADAALGPRPRLFSMLKRQRPRLAAEAEST